MNDTSYWFAELTKEHDRLKRVNEQLVEALKEYLDWHESQFMLPSGNFEDPDQHELAKSARAALAAAEQGET